MQAIFSMILIPLMFLNMFGGIVSGIWLAVLGQWWAIGYGIAGLFLSTTLLGLAMMPGLIFAAPAAILADKGKLVLAFPLMLLSQLYTYVIVTAWCLFVFLTFMKQITGPSLTALDMVIWRRTRAVDVHGSARTTGRK